MKSIRQMMFNQQYLKRLLKAQNLPESEKRALRRMRAEVEKSLMGLPGNPIFIYGGSFKKNTIIRESYDLDIVIRWPFKCDFTLKDLFDMVGDRLNSEFGTAKPKTVAWTLPVSSSFHIDIVPCRVIDPLGFNANLYRTDTGKTLKTSITRQVNTVINSGRQEVIRLIKLWKVRNNVPIKTFVLEMMTIKGCYRKHRVNLETQLDAALEYISDNIITARIEDPANTNNILSDTIDFNDKIATQIIANATLKADTWNEVFKE